MNRLDTSTLKSRHDLVVMFKRDGHQSKPCSGHFVCCCPFHKEKTGSCHVWTDHWHCFGCGSHGDIISYVRQTRGLGFVDAIKFLGGEVQADYRPKVRVAPPQRVECSTDFTALSFEFMSAVSEDRMNDAAAKLGVSPDSLWWTGCGWSDKWKAWSFPMRDGSGKVIGIRLRRSNGEKFAVPGSRGGLIMPSIPVERRVFILEGPTDTAAALTMGFYAIGRPSCNSSVNHVLQFLELNRSVTEVVIVSDNDSPGIKGARELRDKLTMVNSYFLLLPPKDFRRYVQIGGGKGLLESIISSQVPRQKVSR